MKRSRLCSAVLCLAGLAACARLPERPQLAAESGIAVTADETELDRQLGHLESTHPGSSAFRLVSDGPEAFAIRAHTANQAGRSLDVQTYIWHADDTGLYLAHRLLQAADRGVSVRLLLDDLDARARNAGLAALDAHPNIRVRVFNPFASRRGVLRKLGELVGSFGRINHRMHNKSWIADNRLAVAGGRNIGDEYFGASDAGNFVDLDFAMAGPVVRDVTAAFDAYWNSAAAYPMEVLDPKRVSAAELEALRAALAARAGKAQSSRFAEALRGNDAIRRLVAGDWPMTWVGGYRFVADDPLKATLEDSALDRSRVLQLLVPEITATQRSLSVVSPYFVPRDAGTELFTGVASAGTSVAILTNSLAATDVAAVHAGYSRHRRELLEGGVQLFELKPSGEDQQGSFAGSSGASLHTKALAIDGESLFVGSYNLDPRSTSLNCEQGVLVRHAGLAREFETIFAGQVAGDRAWRVELDGDDLRWSDGAGEFDGDPQAGFMQRFQAWLARLLHVDAQL